MESGHVFSVWILQVGSKTTKQCIQFYYTWKKDQPEEYRRMRNAAKRRRQQELITRSKSAATTTQQTVPETEENIFEPPKQVEPVKPKEVGRPKDFSGSYPCPQPGCANVSFVEVTFTNSCMHKALWPEWWRNLQLPLRRLGCQPELDEKPLFGFESDRFKVVFLLQPAAVTQIYVSKCPFVFLNELECDWKTAFAQCWNKSAPTACWNNQARFPVPS